MLSSLYHDVLAMLVPSCGAKSGTSCYHLVTRAHDGGNRLATRCSNTTNKVRNKLLHVGVVMNLLTNCYVQTLPDLLEQLVGSVLAYDSNLFQSTVPEHLFQSTTFFRPVPGLGQTRRKRDPFTPACPSSLKCL